MISPWNQQKFRESHCEVIKLHLSAADDSYSSFMGGWKVLQVQLP